MSTERQLKLPSLGSRICINGHIGTIRYIGPLPPSTTPNQSSTSNTSTSNTIANSSLSSSPISTPPTISKSFDDILWYGIEWDSEQRGKHDGIYQGQRVFYCELPGNRASFIKIPKLLPPIEYNPHHKESHQKIVYGISFLDALKEKYTHHTDILPTIADSTTTTKTIFDTTSTINASKSGSVKGMEEMMLGDSKIIQVKAIGFDKVKEKQQLFKLKEVGLSSSFISHAYSLDKKESKETITELSPNIQQLDLSHNLISEWNVVAEIVGSLPHCTDIRLSFNRFKPLSLNLNSTISTLVDLEDHAELSIPLLHSSISRFGKSFQHLISLTLTNTFISWQDILYLEPSMSNLQHLYFAKNNISSLESRSDSSSSSLVSWTSTTFQHLKTLVLDSNHITSFSVLKPISKLPSLTSLSLANNPLTHISHESFTSSSSSSTPNITTTTSTDTASIKSQLKQKGDEDIIANGFRTLTHLNISNTLIHSWNCINSLDKLPSLTHLRITNIPLFKEKPLISSPMKSSDTFNSSNSNHSALSAMSLEKNRNEIHDMRTWIIARISRLQVLNGGIITAKERRSSELYYLSMISRLRFNIISNISSSSSSSISPNTTTISNNDTPISLPPSSNNSNSTSLGFSNFLRDHPRYMSLCQRHGEPILPHISTSSFLSLSQGTLKDRTIEITFILHDPFKVSYNTNENKKERGTDNVYDSMDHIKSIQHQRILKSMKIFHLRGYIRRLFHLKRSSTISFISSSSYSNFILKWIHQDDQNSTLTDIPSLTPSSQIKNDDVNEKDSRTDDHSNNKRIQNNEANGGELLDEFKDLDYYSIENGDCIHIYLI